MSDHLIVVDVKSVINGLIEKLGEAEIDTNNWLSEIKDMKENYPLNYNQEEKGPLKVPYVLEELQKMSEEDSIVVSGVSTITGFVDVGGTGQFSIVAPPGASWVFMALPYSAVARLWGIGGRNALHDTSQCT